MKKIITLLIVSTIILCGCSSKKETKEEKVEVQKITCAVKDEFIDDGDTILIDVRTEKEYKEKHLKGAVNIPLDNIVRGVDENEKVNYGTKIVVYCQSGKRSLEAGKALIKEGYKNVYDLGAISNCDS